MKFHINEDAENIKKCLTKDSDSKRCDFDIRKDLSEFNWEEMDAVACVYYLHEAVDN